jgi:hypothetical protein
MIHERQYTSSLALRDGGDGRTLVGPVLPWGVEARAAAPDAGDQLGELVRLGRRMPVKRRISRYST